MPAKAPETAQDESGDLSGTEIAVGIIAAAQCDPRGKQDGRLDEVRQAIVAGLGDEAGVDLARVAESGADAATITRAARAARPGWAQAHSPTGFFMHHLRKAIASPEIGVRQTPTRPPARAEWQRPLGQPDRRPAERMGAAPCISPPVSEEQDLIDRERSLAAGRQAPGGTIAQMSDEDRQARESAHAAFAPGGALDDILVKLGVRPPPR